MKSNQFPKVLFLLLVLAVVTVGVLYIFLSTSPQVKFSTSYRDYPDPKFRPESAPQKIAETPGLIRSFDISQDEGRIAIATSKGVFLYDLKTLKEIKTIPVSGQITKIQFSPDTSRLAVVGFMSTQYQSGHEFVTVWDTTSWNTLYDYESETDIYNTQSALAWSPNGKQIAFAIPDRGLSVIDIATGQRINALEDFIAMPFDISWSPDGSRIIANGDYGNGIRRWRLDTDKWIRLWDARLQPATQTIWSPDGNKIASGHYGGVICIWNVKSNECEGNIQAHFNWVGALDWSPDGTQIASASGAIRIWDVSTGEMRSAFGFYDGIVYEQLQWFDPQTVATLETSYTEYIPSTIHFWDVTTGDVKLAFHGWDNIQGLNNGGIMVGLDDVQISNDRAIIQVSLRFDTPEISIAAPWNLTMTDSQGRMYPLTDITPSDMDTGVTRVYQTVPLQESERITLDLVSFPLQERMPLMMDISANPGRFTFNPNTLQIGDSMTLNKEIQANGYLLRLIEVRKTTANELLFEFDTEGYFSGVMLYSSAAGGSSTNIAKNDKIISSISFSEMPTEPIDIEVTKIYYDAFGPWSLDFQVAASMFADLPEVTPAPVSDPVEAKFTSQDPLFLEVQSLAEQFDQSMVQGPGWVRVVSEVVTESTQSGHTYPPPYYQDEQWLEIDSNGWVTRSLVTHWDANKNILQQSVSVGTQSMNLTTGEAMQFPLYRLSLNWLLSDLDYALNHSETVMREETICEDASPCLLVTMSDGYIARRVWVNMQTGQQVKLQTSQEANRLETILFTQTFLFVERMDKPPQKVLDVFARVLLPAP